MKLLYYFSSSKNDIIIASNTISSNTKTELTPKHNDYQIPPSSHDCETTGILTTSKEIALNKNDLNCDSSTSATEKASEPNPLRRRKQPSSLTLDANSSRSKEVGLNSSLISQQLEQSIHTLHELGNKLDWSHKETENMLVKKNDSFRSTLEEAVKDIKDRQEKEQGKIDDITNKINSMIALMTDRHQEESNALTQKQVELTNMQVRVDTLCS